MLNLVSVLWPGSLGHQYKKSSLLDDPFFLNQDSNHYDDFLWIWNYLNKLTVLVGTLNVITNRIQIHKKKKIKKKNCEKGKNIQTYSTRYVGVGLSPDKRRWCESLVVKNAICTVHILQIIWFHEVIKTKTK